MILNWLDAKHAEDFGKSLAQQIIERFPLSNTTSTNKDLARQEAMLNKLHLQITQFKSNNRLNLYKKAKLVNAFKSELIIAGYDKDFINQVALGLLHMI
jgi:hypothetical protein